MSGVPGDRDLVSKLASLSVDLYPLLQEGFLQVIREMLEINTYNIIRGEDVVLTWGGEVDVECQNLGLLLVSSLTG